MVIKIQTKLSHTFITSLNIALPTPKTFPKHQHDTCFLVLMDTLAVHTGNHLTCDQRLWTLFAVTFADVEVLPLFGCTTIVEVTGTNPRPRRTRQDTETVKIILNFDLTCSFHKKHGRKPQSSTHRNDVDPQDDDNKTRTDCRQNIPVIRTYRTHRPRKTHRPQGP